MGLRNFLQARSYGLTIAVCVFLVSQSAEFVFTGALLLVHINTRNSDRTPLLLAMLTACLLLWMQVHHVMTMKGMPDDISASRRFFFNALHIQCVIALVVSVPLFHYLRKTGARLFMISTAVLIISGMLFTGTQLISLRFFEINFFSELSSMVIDNQLVQGSILQNQTGETAGLDVALGNTGYTIREFYTTVNNLLAPAYYMIQNTSWLFFLLLIYFTIFPQGRQRILQPLRTLRLPLWMLWPLLAGWIILLLKYKNIFTPPYLITAFTVNFMAISIFLHFCQGIGIASHLLARLPFGPVGRLLLLAVIFAFATLRPVESLFFLGVMITGSGLFDQWFNYRRLNINGEHGPAGTDQ